MLHSHTGLSTWLALLLISMTHVLVFNKSINYVYKGDLHHIGHTLPTTNFVKLGGILLEAETSRNFLPERNLPIVLS